MRQTWFNALFHWCKNLVHCVNQNYMSQRCRGVYISDSVLVELGIYQVHRGQHEFWFFDFSQNCELRFCSNFQHRQYAMAWRSFQYYTCGKFLLVEKIRLKKSTFLQLSKNGVEFLHSICAGLRRSGALQNGCKKFEISSKLFRQSVPNFFHRVHLKMHWRFTVDRTGAHLCRSVEGRWPHSCITFKKVPVDTVPWKWA